MIEVWTEMNDFITMKNLYRKNADKWSSMKTSNLNAYYT